MKIIPTIILGMGMLTMVAAQDTVRTAPRRPTQTVPVMIPAGTPVEIRVNETLSSDTATSGQRFTGSLAEAITVDGQTVFPVGSEVTGRVLDAKPSGRLSDSGELTLSINTIRSGQQAVAVSTRASVIKGTSHAGSNTAKIGGGAALGAIIGAVAGGGRGAAIGAGVGAAAGTGAAAATGKREATVESEALLRFVTTNDATVGSAKRIMREDEEVPELKRRDTGDDVPELKRRDTGDIEAHRDDAVITNSANNVEFSARDRRVIQSCFVDHLDEISVELTQREALPSGLERQVAKGATLPEGLQKRVRSMPLVCERQLAVLEGNLERVMLNRKVLLIDGNYKILDMFELGSEVPER